VLAADLVALFGVSEDTVRRDLRDMAERGECERVYGGALTPSPRARPMAARLGVDMERKNALAKAAVGLIAPHMTLFLDTGSTNLAIAQNLPEGLGLTVVTNAPDIALALVQSDGIETILLGGRMDPHTRACLGARALADLASFRPDMTILGACGLDPIAGVTAARYEDAEIKREAVRQARSVLVAVTNEKFSTPMSQIVCDLERLTHLVVEADMPDAKLIPYQAAGTRIHHAGPLSARSSENIASRKA